MYCLCRVYCCLYVRRELSLSLSLSVYVPWVEV